MHVTKDAYTFEIQSSRIEEFILRINKANNVPPYFQNVFYDKLASELKSTTNIQIETPLEVWFNMLVWHWIVLEYDYPMPQMCILQNVRLQSNPTTLVHLVTCPKNWHGLINHEQMPTFLTNTMTPCKDHQSCTIQNANQSMETFNLMKYTTSLNRPRHLQNGIWDHHTIITYDLLKSHRITLPIYSSAQNAIGQCT